MNSRTMLEKYVIIGGLSLLFSVFLVIHGVPIFSRSIVYLSES